LGAPKTQFQSIFPFAGALLRNEQNRTDQYIANLKPDY